MEKQQKEKKTSKTKAQKKEVKSTKSKKNLEEKIKSKQEKIVKKDIPSEKKFEKKHNGIISFWKFMFCLLIVIYHTHIFSKTKNNILFPKGSIGVEFFFLVSGYLMTKAALKNKEETDFKNLGIDTLKFVGKKWKTFIPYTIVAGLMSLTVINYYHLNNTLFNNISSIWDMLLLRMTGIRGLSVNGPIWYISSMLIAMLILYPLIRRYKEKFLTLFAPVILIVGLGIFSALYGNLRSPDIWIGFAYKGTIRAFFELLLGGCLYLICEKIKKLNFTKFGKLLITLIEISCFVLPFLMSQFMDSATKFDYIMLVVISIGIVLAFSEQTLEYNFFCNKFSYWLEKLSLTLYIFHFPVRLFFRNASFLKVMPYWKRLGIYIPITIALSIIIMYVMDYLKKKNFFMDKIKKLIIKEKIES